MEACEIVIIYRATNNGLALSSAAPRRFQCARQTSINVPQKLDDLRAFNFSRASLLRVHFGLKFSTASTTLSARINGCFRGEGRSFRDAARQSESRVSLHVVQAVARNEDADRRAQHPTKLFVSKRPNASLPRPRAPYTTRLV